MIKIEETRDMIEAEITFPVELEEYAITFS